MRPTGEFGGLGIEITLENGILTIVSPIEDTPAYKAGLKPGDKILKIDGETTKNITLLKAVKQMRGRPGTKVTLTIMREGFREFKDYTLERAIIHVHSVKTQTLEKGYPYVKITTFQENTDTDLANAIKKMGGDESIKGMVLDLRNDPGGLLDQAWKVASLFLEKGDLIVYTDGRVKDQQMEFKATGTGKHYKFKMAVLINEGSASASEIVAGALQDHDRAVIFGTKSFGKASVQTIIPLDDETGLRLTTAYYYTPKGRNIQKTGIVPDVDMKEEVKKQREHEAEEETKPENKDKAKRSDLSGTGRSQNRSGFEEGFGVVEIRPYCKTVQIGKCEQAIGGCCSVHKVVASRICRGAMKLITRCAIWHTNASACDGCKIRRAIAGCSI